MVSLHRGRSGWWLAFRPYYAVADEHQSAGPSAAAAQPRPVPAEAAATPGFIDELAAALASVRTVISHTLDLAALEGRRAALALVWMVALALGAVVLTVTAWAGLMAALVLLAVNAGVPWMAALLVLTLVNLLAGGGAIYLCIGKSRDLLFAATRRQIAGRAPQPPQS